MKKIISLFSVCAILAVSCTKSSINEEINNEDAAASPVVHRGCASHEVLEAQLKEDATLAGRMEAIESFTAKYSANNAAARLIAGGIIEIPVVVNVVYKTAAQNISDAQIATQIAVLNADFAATNADVASIPTIFQGVQAGNTNIRFVLDQTRRVATSKTSFTTNDGMKKASGGGIAPLSPTTKLNIWVCNMGGGILGYAQFPGGSAATDGIVLDDNATGRTGTAAAPFNKGRTATHEVGHWMNLRHIWGDATCGSDQVGDTPTHNTANYGCPAAGHLSTCSGTPVEMTMNYMDYTDDACMYMFSLEQEARMLAVFSPGGPRNSFAQL